MDTGGHFAWKHSIFRTAVIIRSGPAVFCGLETCLKAKPPMLLTWNEEQRILKKSRIHTSAMEVCMRLYQQPRFSIQVPHQSAKFQSASPPGFPTTQIRRGKFCRGSRNHSSGPPSGRKVFFSPDAVHFWEPQHSLRDATPLHRWVQSCFFQSANTPADGHT